MPDKKFKLTHKIPIELFAECDTRVEVRINDVSCFTKQYASDTLHKEVLELVHDYDQATKNTMSFLFSGDREVEKRSLKIKQICINDQTLNLFNAEYFPELNQEWWEQLNDSDKKKYNERIYGTMGSEFGWYGEINFYYCCGLDQRDKFRYNNQSNDTTRLLDERLNWIYLDQKSVKEYNKINDQST